MDSVGQWPGFDRVLNQAKMVPDPMMKTLDLLRKMPFDEVIDMLPWIQRCGGEWWLVISNSGKVINVPVLEVLFFF